MKSVALDNGKVTLVSARDYAFVRRWAWTFDTSTGYAVRYTKTKGRRQKHYLHLAIAGRAKRHGGQQIDHRNRDKLDNQRSNLRPSSLTGQRGNRTKQRNNTSGFKGVFWHRPTRKWMAQIGVRRQQVYLGLFASKYDAARANNRAAREYFGRFACLNLGV